MLDVIKLIRQNLEEKRKDPSELLGPLVLGVYAQPIEFSSLEVDGTTWAVWSTPKVKNKVFYGFEWNALPLD